MMATEGRTPAQERLDARLESGRRWIEVLKAVARGELPAGATPEDLDDQDDVDQ